MPTLQIRKSIRVKATPEKVYAIISDYHHWPAWSPWTLLEPGVKFDTQPDGKKYSWVGKMTGTGNMVILKEEAPRRLDMQVNFITPWKSTAPVWFELKALGEETEIHWNMDSSLPWFMFFMTKMMTAFIGMDYTRGLAMLKDYIETGKVPSRLEFTGIQQREAVHYIGITSSGALDAVGPDMERDFAKLYQWKASQQISQTGPAFAIYHKWDLVKNETSFTVALPIRESIQTPAGFTQGDIPALKTYSIRHIGAYRHLANAWSSISSMQRGKAFKTLKGVDPFEVYVSEPGSVPEEALITEIFFPAK